MSTRIPAGTGGVPGRGTARRTSSILLVAAALAIVFVIVAALAAAAAYLGEQGPPLRTIDVPGDHPTIQAAIDAARPGDIIRVGPGTYAENLLLNKPVSLTARSYDEINPAANTTIIDGGSGGPAITLPAGMSQMPTVRGFVIKNGTRGVQANSDVILEFNYLIGSPVLADYLGGAGGVNQGNVYFGAGDDAIQIALATAPLRIENNRILYSTGSGIQIGLPGVTPAVQTPAIEISNNMIIGSGLDGIVFVDAGTTDQDRGLQFVIGRNLIARNTRSGVAVVTREGNLQDLAPADATERVHAYNNTFFENGYGLVGGDNLVAINSIFVGQATTAAWKVQGSPGFDSTLAYSLFFRNRLDFEESTVGVGNILGQDPLFVAPPNAGQDGIWETVDDDFSGLLLAAGSPAIDKGVVQFTASSGDLIPSVPITGFAGAAPDLGWREYGSPLFITATPTMSPTPTLLATGTPPSPTSTSTANPTATIPSATGTVISPTVPPATLTPGATATGAASPTGSSVDIEIIVPTSASTNTTLNVTVTGTGFQTGATVVLEGGQGSVPVITNVQVLNSTTITLTLQTSTPSVWDIRVTNPDGSYTILEDAFTVMP